MKLFRKKDVEQSSAAKEAYQQYFMAPVLDGQQPGESNIISHQYNSHTIRPKFASDTTKFPEEFQDLDGLHLVDFPGLFETRGPEIDIAIHLTLQRILLQAKSAKVLVLIAASCLINTNNHVIDLIKHQMNLMFKDPETMIPIALTKATIVQESMDDDEIVDVALGNNGEMRNFKGYNVFRVE